MKEQTAEILHVSLINWVCYSIQPHIEQAGCVPAVLQGWEELVQLCRGISDCIQAQQHQSWRVNSCSSPQKQQNARGKLPSNRVGKYIWGNVRLVQAKLILLNHHWQEPVSRPAFSDAAITAQASDSACILSILPSSPGLSTHSCSVGFMLLQPFICIYLLLF